MALADRFRDLDTSRTGVPCSVGVLLDTMTGADLEAFREAMGTRDNWGLPASQIYEGLKAEGYEVSLQQINKHRGGKCRCKAEA